MVGDAQENGVPSLIECEMLTAKGEPYWSETIPSTPCANLFSLTVNASVNACSVLEAKLVSFGRSILLLQRAPKCPTVS